MSDLDVRKILIADLESRLDEMGLLQARARDLEDAAEAQGWHLLRARRLHRKANALWRTCSEMTARCREDMMTL